MPISKLKKLKFWRIFYICNFDFVFIWLGIQYDSMVWVIMRRQGVSSERKRSSCSSLKVDHYWKWQCSVDQFLHAADIAHQEA